MACARIVSDFEVLSADDLGRRRDHTDAEKIRIVDESFRRHRQGSATARRCGLSRSLLTRWRKKYREGLLGGVVPAFTSLQIAAEPALSIATANERPGVEDKVEMTLAIGRRLSVAPTIGATVLSRLLRVLNQA